MKYFPFAHRQVCWGRATDGVDTEMRNQDSAQTRVRVPSECTVLAPETFVMEQKCDVRKLRVQSDPHYRRKTRYSSEVKQRGNTITSTPLL